MRINELMRIVDNGTVVELWNEDNETITKFVRQPDTEVNEAEYGKLEVEGIGVDCFDGEPTLIISCEKPTWKISCSFKVEVEVTVDAYTEEEALSKVKGCDASELLDGYFDNDVEIYDTSYGDVEWEDAERW